MMAWDEFDSNDRNFATLLPLLWEGELHLGDRDLKLGRAIIVLAGSDPTLPDAMNDARSMQIRPAATEKKRDTRKLADLLSRINGGVLEIPSFDVHDDGRDRRVDKVCIAVELLRARFGEQLEKVPRSLLRFVGLSEFRYGVSQHRPSDRTDSAKEDTTCGDYAQPAKTALGAREEVEGKQPCLSPGFRRPSARRVEHMARGCSGQVKCSCLDPLSYTSCQRQVLIGESL